MDSPLLLKDAQYYPEYGLTWHRPSLINPGPAPAAFRGFSLTLCHCDPQGLAVLCYRSDWGREWTPCYQTLKDCPQGISLSVTTGRCSHGWMPFLFLMEKTGQSHVICILWSGNWAIEITPQGDVAFAQTEEMLYGSLDAGESLSLPQALHLTGDSDIPTLASHFRSFLNHHFLPESRIPTPLVEWNPWWRYEDEEITEDLFLRNAEAAQKLGVTLCTLDAGWFGDASSPAHWTRCRGDWDLVNAARFPHGLRFLSDSIHRLGMAFGLWVEPEALGAESRLIKTHPEWEARRDGKALPEPYLCLGAEGAAAHLYSQLCCLVDTAQCDWLKLDFNVNPGLGCNRADHGHEPGLGLYRHYQAYYALLDQLRARYPRLIIENCSSGGLRMDLEMMRHTDVTFLSDPDETPHSLQCFWAASLFLPPVRLLHWAWSQTRLLPQGGHVFPGFFLTEETRAENIRYSLRGAMLHPLGLSRDLAGLTPEMKKVFVQEIDLYKNHIAPLIQKGELYHLTGQPLRCGARSEDDGRNPPPETIFGSQASKIAAFEWMEDGHGVVLCYALEPWEAPFSLPLRGLSTQSDYCLVNVDTKQAFAVAGKELISSGLPLPAGPAERALCFLIHPNGETNV